MSDCAARKADFTEPMRASPADVERVTYQVSQRADRVSAATPGRIGFGIANDMEPRAEQFS